MGRAANTQIFALKEITHLRHFFENIINIFHNTAVFAMGWAGPWAMGRAGPWAGLGLKFWDFNGLRAGLG